MATLKQFSKKLGEFDRAWTNMFLPTDIPSDIKKNIALELFDIEHFVVFIISNATNWFGIKPDGILLCENGKVFFVPFIDVIELKINFDSHFNGGNFKRDADKIILNTLGNKYTLNCINPGAVYTIDRLVSFGIKETNKKT